MNRINKLFEEKKNNILSVFFTAGHPTLDSTETIIKTLENSGADLIEIGIPFSDPTADGLVIQKSSQVALDNGMSLKLLFEQLKNIRESVNIPLIMMGYLNPVLQYGIENFCKKCNEVGIDGLILPDLPISIFVKEYQETFRKHNLHNIFLISPQTVEERIRLIDSETDGFIYMVASSSITGAKSGISEKQIEYFNRVQSMNLKNPTVIGFGISNKDTFDTACKYANGAIIGSAFVKALDEEGKLEEKVERFVKRLR